MNPWNLSDNQVATMDALLRHLCHKRAARILGVHPYTFERTISNVRKKMGCVPGCKWDHVLMWDRLRRETEQQREAA